MNKKHKLKIGILDNDRDTVKDIKENLKFENFSIDFFSAYTVKGMRRELLNYNTSLDLFILDICLTSDDEDIVLNPELDIFSELINVKGLKFSSWFRKNFSSVPVILMSAIWPQNNFLPSIEQYATCFFNKQGVPKDYDFLNVVVKMAFKCIIGVRLKDIYIEEAKPIIEQINSFQQHFHYVLVEELEDILKLPTEFQIEDKNKRPTLFQIWNNRILGMIEDKNCVPVNNRNNELDDEFDNEFIPILPFSKQTINYFYVNLDEHLDYMGKNYLAPYLLRECARAAYSIYYSLEEHPYDSGKCIFDSSTYAPDLLSGIYNARICSKCRSAIENQKQAQRGWSVYREKAVQTILDYAKEELIKVESNIYGG